jgi:hypothetical protein
MSATQQNNNKAESVAAGKTTLHHYIVTGRAPFESEDMLRLYSFTERIQRDAVVDAFAADQLGQDYAPDWRDKQETEDVLYINYVVYCGQTEPELIDASAEVCQ